MKLDKATTTKTSATTALDTIIAPATRRTGTARSLHGVTPPKAGGTSSAAKHLLNAAPAPHVTALSKAEQAEVERGKLGLSFLQSLWPQPIDDAKPKSAYELMRSLPKELSDRLRADLEPVADGIAHVVAVMDGYRTQKNLSLEHKAPPGLLQVMERLHVDFGADLRADIKDAARYLPPPATAALEKVAAAWDARYAHPGLVATHPVPFHRETAYERLSKLAGVAVGRYPEKTLAEGKAQWDRGERTVVFTQSLGTSTGMTQAVPKKLNDEQSFIREFARAASGEFGHWQEI